MKTIEYLRDCLIELPFQSELKSGKYWDRVCKVNFLKGIYMEAKEKNTLLNYFRYAMHILNDTTDQVFSLCCDSFWYHPRL